MTVTHLTDPRHVIARCIDNNCDQLHPEQARRIIGALESAGLAIVPMEPTKPMIDAACDAEAKAKADVWCGLASAYRAMIRLGKLMALLSAGAVFFHYCRLV